MPDQWRLFDAGDRSTWPPLEHSKASVRVMVCLTPTTAKHWLHRHPDRRVTVGCWRFNIDGSAPYWDVSGPIGVAWLDDETAHWQPLPEPPSPPEVPDA